MRTDVLERVQQRLRAARSALDQERTRLVDLNAQRAIAWVSRNGDRGSQLRALDEQITEATNTVASLERITGGLEPRIEAVVETQAEIAWGTDHLEKARAMVEAYRHTLRVCDLMKDVATELRKATPVFAAAGHRLPPSASDLLRLAAGRWQERMRHEATSMIAAHNESLIPRLQRDIKAAQERLQRALGDLTEEARS